MTTDLRKLAEAATPGPWAANIYDDDRQRTIATVCMVEGWVVGPDCGSERVEYDDHAPAMCDAPYIAACSPDRILALLDVAEKAAAYVATMTEFAQCFQYDRLRDEAAENAAHAENALRTALAALGHQGKGEPG